jgi:hypothetical protein
MYRHLYENTPTIQRDTHAVYSIYMDAVPMQLKPRCAAAVRIGMCHSAYASCKRRGGVTSPESEIYLMIESPAISPHCMFGVSIEEGEVVGCYRPPYVSLL